jgi:carbamoyl-phosphate synthase large subunit
MKYRGNLNILFTCVGRKVSLIQSFRQSFKQLNIEGTIVGIDSSPLSAALNVCDYKYIVPPAKHPEYIHTILSLCREYNIRLLIPLIDIDLLVLAKYRSVFTESGILPLVSCLPVVRICRDKRATAQFFSEYSIPTVQSFSLDSLESNYMRYPLFIKPASGSGSIKAFKILNRDELSFFLKYVPDPIVQEYACGQEYTIDALSDLDGHVINAVPRKRLEVRAGEISKGKTERNWRIIDATVHLLQHLGTIGPTTVQCFVDGNRLQFTEVNPRVGGGLPLTIAAGADYPAQILRMALGEPLEPCIGCFEDDFYMFRYEEAVYVPGEVVRSVPERHTI